MISDYEIFMFNVIQELEPFTYACMSQWTIVYTFVFASRELSSTFSRLCHQVDIAKGDLEEDLKQLKEEIARLEQIATRSNFLR